MSLPAFLTDSGLALTRVRYAKTLTVQCRIYRENVDGEGIHTGKRSLVTSTFCGLSIFGSTTGGTVNPFILSLDRAQTMKTPGTRTLSFAWDENVKTGDWVYITDSTEDPPPDGTDRIVLGTVSKDDPRRYGLQVSAEIQRIPGVA